jgi:hypothetical protein
MSDPTTRLNAALEGRYTIERELGEGGMAKVYLARDEKHSRNVALKVLKPELAAVVGAERFLAEIETTANLQHPHILPLFDSGEADGFLFYVMPYVEGETLRDRIDNEKQLPVDEALGIATAVANALQTAHEAGVIHRDIKPGNILLSRGEPLVADFGIAIAVGAAGGNRLTETGLSVGTPYYMSPEQATGDQAVGPASDTYALACVLFEMLVGEPPYLGNTAQAVLGKIIQGVPVSATSVRKAVPPNVDAAIRKALEKIPADRFPAADQFAKALADPAFRYGAMATVDSAAVGRWKGAAVGTSVVAILALVAAAMGWSRPPAPAPVLRQQIVPIAPERPRPLASFTALAPDGSSMVYAVADGAESWRLWLKPRGAAEATPLPGTEQAQNITYSPGSDWIAFISGNELKKRPVGDGATVTLAEDLPQSTPTSQNALAWLDDGTVVYEMPGPYMMRIPENGGAAETAADFDQLDFTNFAFAGALPGSHGVLATVCTGACTGASIEFVVWDFAADTLRSLLPGVVRGWYTPTGHLMYVRTDGAVFAAPFDLDALELTGDGIPLFDGVSVSTSSPELVVGADGTVLYGMGSALFEERELVWVDQSGTAELVDSTMPPDLAIRTVTLSPTDDRIAFTAGSAVGRQLFVKELPSGPLTMLTTDDGYTRRPVWAPDGQTIAYVTNEDGGAFAARTIRADGSSASVFEILLARDRGVHDFAFSRDGATLVFTEGEPPDDPSDLVSVGLTSGTDAVPLFASDFAEYALALSPDEQWIAYTATTPAGGQEVYVRPYPAADTRIQVSTNGGFGPVWAHERQELFYIDGDGWMSVAMYETDPDFVVTDRERLFDAETRFYGETRAWRMFDVAQDDERFLMILDAGGLSSEERQAIRVFYVQNYWGELLERVGG